MKHIPTQLERAENQVRGLEGELLIYKHRIERLLAKQAQRPDSRIIEAELKSEQEEERHLREKMEYFNNLIKNNNEKT